MKKNIKTAEELSELSGKTKRAIYKNKNLPYDDSEGKRHYDITNPIIKKWLEGKKISKPKKPKPPIKSLPPGKRKEKKKKITSKKNDESQKIPAKEIDLIPLGFEIDSELSYLADSGEITFAQALGLRKIELEKIKIYEQIKDIKSKADERREGLIPRKLIRTVFSKLYEIDMNQFLSMKDKLIPDLAAAFKTKDEALKIKATKIIDRELWKILGNIKRELNKFLQKIGEDEIDADKIRY
jgi:hypothetical protein